jgi:hypothetical protein
MITREENTSLSLSLFWRERSYSYSYSELTPPKPLPLSGIIGRAKHLVRSAAPTSLPRMNHHLREVDGPREGNLSIHPLLTAETPQIRKSHREIQNGTKWLFT